MGQVGALIQPCVVMAFGAYLGLVNQSAQDTSGWLRVPAMLAALILVAQAILEVQQIRSRMHEEEHVIDLDDDDVSATVVHHQSSGPGGAIEAPGRAVHREGPTQVTVTQADNSGGGGGVREKPETIYLVMVLAVWLGLATLANPAAPRILLVMALLASFLLFAEAWQMLRKSSSD